MSLLKPNKERLDRINKEVEESTRNFLTPIFEKRLGKSLRSFTEWANNNRKKMFIINISFLSLLVLYSIFKAYNAKTNFKDVWVMSNKTNEIYIQKNNKWDRQFDNLFKMYNLKYELEDLISKDNLTEQDSIRVEELYKQIFEKNEKEN